MNQYNSYNPFSLEGKKILITGASSGIGKAIAIECSKMGANLIITARNEQRLSDTHCQLQGDGHKCIMADLTKDDELAELLSSIDKLDGVVLCPGIGITSPLKMASPKKIEQVFHTNFYSLVELTRLLQKNRKLNDSASIIALSSVSCHSTLNYGHGIYGASKAALSIWMKYLAKEIANKRIRVNCIVPGMIETPLIENSSYSSEDLAKDMSLYPLKRYGKPEEVAYAAIYLLSDASLWVTGTDLIIDGGISLQ